MREGMLQPYEDNWECLYAELGFLDLLIHREVIRCRQDLPRDQSWGYKGLFISDREIDILLGGRPKDTSNAGTTQPEELLQAADKLRKEILQRRHVSLEQGIYLALPHLADLFGLTPFEEQVVLVCLAPEIDMKYGRFYAYLHDDITCKRPSVDLMMKLLCETWEERIQARSFFSENAPLFHYQILHYQDSNGNPLLGRLLRLDEAVLGFVLGSRSMDKEFAACIRFMFSNDNLEDLRWTENLKTQLVRVTRDHLQGAEQSSRKLIYHFYGPCGTGKKTLAAALCSKVKVPLLIVDLREILLRTQAVEDTILRIFRESILQPAAIYLEHFEKLLGDDDKAVSYRQCIARCINEFSWLTFIATEKAWEQAGLFKDHLFLNMELPMPDMKMRAYLWTTLATGKGRFAPDVNWGELGTKFRFTPGQMQNALFAAQNHTRLRADEGPVITADDLYKGCHAQSNQKLSLLARKLSPRYSWSDITLPQNVLDILHEICAQIKNRQKVYGDWGFEDKLSLGKGLFVLFYGESGTGKTMAVEIMANELHLEAYKIDLSTVVSKYIGETEKNLNKIFQEAETSNAILFFDEADALFGKRSEVKDAHDRYANIEINYLLQRMEEFEGLVILATNMRKNIDDAFFRRIHFAVEFPFPVERDRYLIWKQHIPPTVPIADDVDFNFLANRLNITGGNIRNIVVNSAFLAAENSGVIHMEHMLRATKREYEKIGRMCTETEFAPYYSLLKDS